MLVDGEKGDGGRVMLPSRLGGGVNHRKNGVADRRKRNRAIIDQHLFAMNWSPRPMNDMASSLPRKPK
jgi:hypothetical protein